jgi:hypothetical protein
MNPEDLAGKADTATPDRDLGLAVLIAEAANHAYEPIAVVSSIREAAEHALADLTSRLGALERGAAPLHPHSYVLWARGHDGAYQRHHTINLRGSAAASHAARGTPSSDPTLVITTEGFLNLSQAVEYRLRYADVTTSDVVSAIDVLMSDGNSRVISEDDPGFEQVINAIEADGYVISTKHRQ